MAGFFSFLVTCGLFLLSVIDHVNASVVIESHVRAVAAIFRLFHVTETVELYNDGLQDVSHVYTALPLEIAKNVGHIYAKRESIEIPVQQIYNVSSVTNELIENGVEIPSTSLVVLYRIPLRVKTREKIQYELKYIVGRSPKPFPAASPLAEPQFVRVTDRGLSVSPYYVKKQRTVFTLPSAPSIKKSHGVERQGSADYATEWFYDTAPFTLGDTSAVELQYKLDQHLGFFHAVERKVDISLWGSVSVHERYEFENEAVASSEPYFRGDIGNMMNSLYGRLRPPGINYPRNRICFQLAAKLPRDAYGVEFYDEIGNVSTSYARRTPQYVYAQLEPRYPVLGGWKADWFLDYKLPTSSVVSAVINKIPRKQWAHHQVSITLSPSVVEVFAQNVTVVVTFPPGAQNFKVTTPQHLIEPPVEQLEWGWLDVLVPRRALHFNLGPFVTPGTRQLKHTLLIEYDYPTSWVHRFRTPLGCCIACIIPFLLHIAIRHMHLRTSSSALEIEVLDTHHGALDALVSLASATKQDAETWWKTFSSKGTSALQDDATHHWTVVAETTLRSMSKIVAAVRDCRHAPAQYVRRTTALHQATVRLVELANRAAPSNELSNKRGKAQSLQPQLWRSANDDLQNEIDAAAALKTNKPKTS